MLGHVFEVDVAGHFLQHGQETRIRIGTRRELAEVQDHPLIDVGATVEEGEEFGPRSTRVRQLIRDTSSVRRR